MNNNPLLDNEGESVNIIRLYRLWDNDWNDWFEASSGKSIWTTRPGLEESFWCTKGTPLSDSPEYEIVVSEYELIREYTLPNDD